MSRESFVLNGRISSPVKNEGRKVMITQSTRVNNDLFRDTEITEGFQTLFIHTGYRRPGLAVNECFYSLTKPTNETVNVLSHAIAFGLFVVRFSRVFFLQISFDPWSYPLLCFAGGILALMAMSSIAHLFNCVSMSAHHTGFYLDYAAICVYSFGGSLAFYFYSKPEKSSFILLSSSTVFLTVSALMSSVCVGIACLSRHRWKKTGHIVRTTMFTVYFIIVTLPFTYRATVSQEPQTDSSHYFTRLIIYYILSALVNVTKLPERAFPEVFDFFGQSHHFLHLFSALAAAEAFDVAYVDMHERRSLLSQHPQPNVYNTVGIFVVVVVTQLLIVSWFVRSLLQQDKCKKH